MKKFFSRINLEKVFDNYPFSFSIAILTSILLLILSEQLIATGSNAYSLILRLIWILTLLFPCFLLVEIISRKQKKKNWILFGACVIIGLLYFIYLPEHPSYKEFIRHLTLIGVLHFMIILFPYIDKKDSNPFWHNFMYCLLSLFLNTSNPLTFITQAHMIKNTNF